MERLRLTGARAVVTASAVALVASLFLDWFTYDIGVQDVSTRGWDHPFWGVLPALVGAAMAAEAVLADRAAAAAPGLPWGQAQLCAGVFAACVVVFKLLLGAREAGITLDRGPGIAVAALAAVGLAVGGFLRNRETAVS